MGNHPEWIVADFAILALGAVMVGVNTWATARELEYILEHSDTTIPHHVGVAISSTTTSRCSPGSTPRARAARVCEVIWSRDPEPAAGPIGSFLRLAERTPEAAIDSAQRAIANEDIAYLLYTSGSTSRPKGVQLQHYALIENMWHIGERLHVTEHDRLWLAVSLFWGLGCENALFNLFTHGGCVVLQEHFDAGAALALIERERCTVILRHAEHGAGDRRASRRAASATSPSLRGGATHRHARADHARGGDRRARDLQHLRPHRDLRQLQRHRRAEPLETRLTNVGRPLPGVDAAHRRARDRARPSRGRSRRDPRQGLCHHRLLQGPRANARGLRRARLLPAPAISVFSTTRATSTFAAA